MDQNADIYEMFDIPLPTPDSIARMQNEAQRMKDDMSTYLSMVPITDMRRKFLVPKSNRILFVPIEGTTTLERCRSALRLAGSTYLGDAFFLNDFYMAERLRAAKLNMLDQLISRDNYFRPKKNEKSEKVQPTKQQEVEFEHFLGLPRELIGEIMKKSEYKDAQNLAAACHTANSVYRNSSSSMLLPDITLTIGFTDGQLEARWKLDDEDKNENLDRRLLQAKETVKRKNQLLFNTTLLIVETSTDFSAEEIGDVRKFIGNKKFERVIVKGHMFTDNLRRMIDLFDVNNVEIEINKFSENDVKFPNVKTITVHEVLNDEQGNKLFSHKQFVNITCALNNVDTLRKAFEEWDNEKREIGRWTIMKPFTVFQTPFGRRHREGFCKNKGYLVYLSELDSSKMPHGEITEYHFTPSD